MAATTAPVFERPRTRRAGATREKILSAATGLFADAGFDGVSIDAIARRAGVQLSLIRYHFGSKEELWQATVDAAYAEVDRIFAAALPKLATLSGHDRLRGWLRVYMRTLIEVPTYPRVNLLEGCRDTSRARYLQERHVRRHVKVAAPFFDDPAVRDLLPPIPFERLMFMLLGAAQMPVVLARQVADLTGTDMFDDQTVERHVDDLMRLFAGAD